ncbi:GNAT family N-acetyltransferase [Paenibacillus sp. OV219]|uniref:GNAT family N-acetyltransferase n=1 Tax=Paenibacillus sp. OV219 TaxID=1884377 RepID=UPI0008B21659|nr:GNAT family N-acetyltransferase [Paenibacillus sp. OV219]SEM71189.1 Acetyltransferase (GNAT) domain-containing protein [Paenibacillus sp. OV219]
MLTMIRSCKPEHIEHELDIFNTNPQFNLISKDKSTLTAEDIAAELKDAEQAGAERYLLHDNDQFVGILELLMHNPKDSCTWIGLLIINGRCHGQGYGSAALELFDSVMRERGVQSHRLGVLVNNPNAHRFWQRHGCVEVRPAELPDGKAIMIYERAVGSEINN